MGGILSFSVPPTADDRIVKAMQTRRAAREARAAFGMRRARLAFLTVPSKFRRESGSDIVAAAEP